MTAHHQWEEKNTELTRHDWSTDTACGGIWNLGEHTLSVKVQQNLDHILRLGGLLIPFVLGIKERQFALLRGGSTNQTPAVGLNLQAALSGKRH